MKRQSVENVENVCEKIKHFAVGDNVMILVPELGRGKADFRNVQGVIMNLDAD